MKMKTKASIIVITGLIIFVTSQFSFAIDAPHEPHDGTNVCANCHADALVGGVLESPFWGGTDESAYDLICTSCHQATSAPEEGYGIYGPAVTTHSYLTADPDPLHPKYGTWAIQCRNCHDPHYQRQKNYKSSDPNDYYLATGTLAASPPPSYDPTPTEKKTTLYYSSLTYRLGWDAAKLTHKTGDCRRAILFPNVNRLGYNYLVIAVNETANTITVKGDATAYLYPPTTFAVIYGQYVKDSIYVQNQDGSGAYWPVKLFDQTGANSFADGDGTYNGVCEVCHTRTENPQTHVARFRNTGNQDIDHFPGQQCTICHPHTEGFKGSESPGGFSCEVCHKDLWENMNGTTGYHHYMNNAGASYANVSQPVTMGDTSDSKRNCLMCHADHDIFRPDKNSNGTRAKNLRASISVTPSASNSSTYANTDFDSAPQSDGGICVSCHGAEQTKSYAQTDNTTKTPVIEKAKFTQSAHDYTASSTFARDSSSFNANCSKCHNDTLNPKSRFNLQSSTNKFGNHQSTLRRVTATLGIISPTDPLEEKFCYRCHSSTTDTNPGGGTAKTMAVKDYYGVADMRTSSEGIFAVFGKAYGHNVAASSGRHKPSATEDDLSVANRHVECCDCHNPHTIGGINPDSPEIHPTVGVTRNSNSNKINDTKSGSKALQGVWGVDVSSWPSGWTQPKNFTILKPAEKEYQICFKCHSYYAWGEGYGANYDIAWQFNPNNCSAHPVVVPLSNQTGSVAPRSLDGTQMRGPFTGNVGSTTMYCSDCHGNDAYGVTDPQGPHRSSQDNLLTDFRRDAQRYYWPNAPDGSGWSLYQIDQGMGNWTTRLLCRACHVINDGTWKNNVHSWQYHKDSEGRGRCTNCHTVSVHGGEHSRFVGGSFVAGFRKASYPTGYHASNCYVPEGCGGNHLTFVAWDCGP